MKKLQFIAPFTAVILASCAALLLASCATPKAYFSADIRDRLQHSSINVQELQFYIDRDVELRRVVASRDAHVSSGVVRLVDGKYTNIIKLKKNTPGICTGFYSNALNVAFEKGDGSYLNFSVSHEPDPASVYQVTTQGLFGNSARVVYDGETYYIVKGMDARLLIKRDELRKEEIKSRTMKGRTLE